MKAIMKYLMMTLALAFMSFDSFPQEGKASRTEKKEQRQWEREQRKAEKDKRSEQAIRMTKLMVDSQKFVLEATYLGDKYGNCVPVSPTINFISVEDEDVTLQVGSASSVGYNGVGGQTVEGRLLKYKVNQTGKQKKNYNIYMSVMTPGASYDIDLFVSPEGYADARIRSTWPGQLNYHGKLVPPGQSKVYKGTPTY